ncbi:MAG: D-alanine--D-alanine ligase [Gammaproteobacteria bacterium]|jgi:biotin carboxylase
MTIRKNIFVVGLEDFNLALLREVRHAEQYAFHGLLDYTRVTKDPNARVDELLRDAFAELDAFPGSIDAIVGYWDFPTVLMMPILRRRYGLHGPTLESVLRCEHKYWARIEQSGLGLDVVPPFALVDPFDEAASCEPPIPFPFWIKPIKAHSSKLGFRVSARKDYLHALKEIRAGIEYFAVNLGQIMKYADLPAEIQAADGKHCIAEAIISAGRQCTLEGYVFAGHAEVYGIVDSIRGANRSSFERYQYPSTLPLSVKRRMIDIAKQVITSTGLDESPFNMEFFWQRRMDKIWLLETNARISKSHSPLFHMVEGVPHKEVMIDVALGRKPEYPLGAGRFRHAAKFMLRRYGCDDGDVVTAVPSEADLARIKRQFPGTRIRVHVRSGMRLGDVHFRDSYSHELAEVFVGADSQSKLMQAYRDISAALKFSIRPGRESRFTDEAAEI